MWAMIIGALAGAAANGIATYQNNKKLAEAYSKAAKTYTDATKKYSGKNAERANEASGQTMANTLNSINNSFAANDKNNLNNPYAADITNKTAEGYNLGSQLQSQKNAANFNKETAESQAALKQAGVDFAVNNQTQQAVMNGIGGLADMYKNTQGGTQ